MTQSNWPNDMSKADLAALRARQKSRSRALALVLVAVAVLFFAITLVKLRAEAARGHSLLSPAITGRPIPAPAPAATPN